MYGLFRAVGAGPLLRLGGGCYDLRPRCLRHYGIIEARMLQVCGNPFDAVRLLRPFGQSAVEDGFKTVRHWNEVEFGDLLDWLKTEEGRVLGLWLALQHHGITFDDVVDQQGDERWWSKEALPALAQANCEDEQGALVWLDDGPQDEEAPSIDWSRLFRVLSEEPFNISMREIGELSLRQVRTLTTDRKNLIIM